MNPLPDTRKTAGKNASSLTESFKALAEARCHDPFTVLGVQGGWRYFWLPWARGLHVGPLRREALRLELPGLFRVEDRDLGAHPLLHWEDSAGCWHEEIDPWGFGPQIGDLDLHLFGEGRHWHVYRLLGAHPGVIDGVPGTHFATWAPNAARVSVVGDFNGWDGRRHPLRCRGQSGVWEIFLPGVGEGAIYRFEIRSRVDGSVQLKTDPYGQAFEVRPANAALVCGPSRHAWTDAQWMTERRTRDWLHAPLSIYELHLGSWQRAEDGGFLGYRELAPRVVEHVRALGFTHIELLPVTEHPLDESWGYQATGYFAPTSRFGTPDDFRFFVDYCHRHGIGVLLDWVPAHFPRDAHALARFDGSALYEHADPRRGEHRDWGTLIYDYGRHEVRNFLLASANFWLEEFHLDGLRVDAVASMLYLDYSREAGDWEPNVHGGRENLEAVRFLRELNELTHGLHPGTVTIAEESTAWPQVSRPVWVGGLGFSMKWNMGWMHDSLRYLARDPVHRSHHHNELSFGLLYAFSENFVLALSHDEVVHGKRSLLQKMPGDAWQRYANLRLLYAWQFTYPGAKLLFMGGEFAQEREWAHARALDWERLDDPAARGVFRLLSDLNHLYRTHSALHAKDFEPAGFEWLECHDASHSVVAWLRRDGERCCAVVLNFTPVLREAYRLGVPLPGRWREVLNTDSRHYGGSDAGNAGALCTSPEPAGGRTDSLLLRLPPLAVVVLVPEGDDAP